MFPIVFMSSPSQRWMDSERICSSSCFLFLSSWHCDCKSPWSTLLAKGPAQPQTIPTKMVSPISHAGLSTQGIALHQRATSSTALPQKEPRMMTKTQQRSILSLMKNSCHLVEASLLQLYFTNLVKNYTTLIYGVMNTLKCQTNCKLH